MRKGDLKVSGSPSVGEDETSILLSTYRHRRHPLGPTLDGYQLD